MTAITPGRLKVARCYSDSPCKRSSIFILNFIISKHMPDGWDLYHNHERIEEKLQRDSRRDDLIEERQSELSEKNLTVSPENRNIIE